MSRKSGDVIFFSNSSGAQGREQSGDRPGIVVTTQNNVHLLIPLTSKKGAIKFVNTCSIVATNTNGLSTDSVALIFHLRSIDESRIKKQLGSISKKDAITLNSLLGKVAQIDLTHLPE
jgi:mRNA-degrading endonuclease toxin of MazEF toxin-antitoxin module